jgi:hypothetical protein
MTGDGTTVVNPFLEDSLAFFDRYSELSKRRHHIVPWLLGLSNGMVVLILLTAFVPRETLGIGRPALLLSAGLFVSAMLACLGYGYLVMKENSMVFVILVNFAAYVSVHLGPAGRSPSYEELLEEHFRRMPHRSGAHRRATPEARLMFEREVVSTHLAGLRERGEKAYRDARALLEHWGREFGFEGLPPSDRPAEADARLQRRLKVLFAAGAVASTSGVLVLLGAAFTRW